MDEALRHFRRHANRELGDRQGAERRYSADLRQAAVAYWQRQEQAGEGLAAVARALGVAPVSLRRWAQDEGFEAVHVVPDPAPVSRVTVIVDAEQIRIEGLDVEVAVQLIARLR